MWRNAEVGLTKVDEGGDDGDRVWNQMYQLNVVEEEEAAEEITHPDRESVLDVREEDDGLAGPLCRELLACPGLQPTSVLGLSNPRSTKAWIYSSVTVDGS
jgi:hypothetical protein